MHPTRGTHGACCVIFTKKKRKFYLQRQGRTLEILLNASSLVNLVIVFGWPKSSFGFFCTILPKALNQLFGQSSIIRPCVLINPRFPYCACYMDKYMAYTKSSILNGIFSSDQGWGNCFKMGKINMSIESVCHPAISSSVVPFSSCPQSLSASESFPMSHHFMANRWGNSGNGVRLYFSGLQNHCRWCLQPWN